MPGLAKTLLIKSLGSALGVHCDRIQFTPDLLPSDVVGTMIFQPKIFEP
jgi:MoxR-like ATPase